MDNVASVKVMEILRDGLTHFCVLDRLKTVCVIKQMWSLESRGKTIQFEYEMSHTGTFWKVWFLVGTILAGSGNLGR